MAITYMTKDGYKKKMEEIAYLESVDVQKYPLQLLKLATKATSRKMLNMTLQKKHKACWK